MDTQKSVLLIVAVLVAGLFTGYAFLGKSSSTGELESTPTGESFFIRDDDGGGGGLTCACGSTSTVLNRCKRLTSDNRWIDCGLGPVGCYEGWKCW